MLLNKTTPLEWGSSDTKIHKFVAWSIVLRYDALSHTFLLRLHARSSNELYVQLRFSHYHNSADPPFFSIPVYEWGYRCLCWPSHSRTVNLPRELGTRAESVIQSQKLGLMSQVDLGMLKSESMRCFWREASFFSTVIAASARYIPSCDLSSILSKLCLSPSFGPTPRSGKAQTPN